MAFKPKLHRVNMHDYIDSLEVELYDSTIEHLCYNGLPAQWNSFTWGLELVELYGAIFGGRIN